MDKSKPILSIFMVYLYRKKHKILKMTYVDRCQTERKDLEGLLNKYQDHLFVRFRDAINVMVQKVHFSNTLN